MDLRLYIVGIILSGTFIFTFFIGCCFCIYRCRKPRKEKTSQSATYQPEHINVPTRIDHEGSRRVSTFYEASAPEPPQHLYPHLPSLSSPPASPPPSYNQLYLLKNGRI